VRPGESCAAFFVQRRRAGGDGVEGVVLHGGVDGRVAARDLQQRGADLLGACIFPRATSNPSG